VESFTTC